MNLFLLFLLFGIWASMVSFEETFAKSLIAPISAALAIGILAVIIPFVMDARKRLDPDFSASLFGVGGICFAYAGALTLLAVFLTGIKKFEGGPALITIFAIISLILGILVSAIMSRIQEDGITFGRALVEVIPGSGAILELYIWFLKQLGVEDDRSGPKTLVA